MERYQIKTRSFEFSIGKKDYILTAWSKTGYSVPTFGFWYKSGEIKVSYYFFGYQLEWFKVDE